MTIVPIYDLRLRGECGEISLSRQWFRPRPLETGRMARNHGRREAFRWSSLCSASISRAIQLRSKRAITVSSVTSGAALLADFVLQYTTVRRNQSDQNQGCHKGGDGKSLAPESQIAAPHLMTTAQVYLFNRESQCPPNRHIRRKHPGREKAISPPSVRRRAASHRTGRRGAGHRRHRAPEDRHALPARRFPPGL